MKPPKMTEEEIELLREVRFTTSVRKLSEFFNRPQTTIKNHIQRISKR